MNTVEAIRTRRAVKVYDPSFQLSREEKDELLVVVRDGQKRQVLPHGETANPKKDRVKRAFNFVFTDWTISLQGDFTSPEKWARANFALNMTLSAVLAAVLLGGIALTVRTALREMNLSAMKNEFVSNVSHELRTPLSSIRVFGEFMRRGRVVEQSKVREYGSYIETESRRLTQLINNILDFSRIESGRKVYTFEAADIEEILAGTLSTFSYRLRDKGFDLSYHGPEDPLPEIEVDANAIDRAVANLLDNAVKYSDGDRRIVVDLAQDGNEAVISVSDHGIGIPRDQQERIFERFHRVSTGLVHDVKGSGLGLSLVRHIAEAHGGQVIDLDTGKAVTDIPLPGMPHLGSGIYWKRDGKWVFATPNVSKGLISVLDLETWKLIKEIPTDGPGFFMRSQANSPYAWTDVFFGSNNDAVHLIDKQTLEVAHTLRPMPGKNAAHVEFTNDGRYALLSVWDTDGALLVYDAKTLEEVKRIPMNKPSGKYNVGNKIEFAEGTSH